MNQSKHIPGLDLIRFWAACQVAAFHLAYWSWISPEIPLYRVAGGAVRYESLEPFTWFGWLGVETFFVISGCVICISAERASPYQFLRGRIGRLYPAVWICASITMLVSLALNLSPAAELAIEYMRSLGIFFSKGPWIDGVYRTLIPEGVFYALVFVTLTVDRFRHTEAIALLLGAYSIAFWIVGLSGLVSFNPGVWFYFSKNAIFFALGMMVWLIKQRGASRTRVGFACLLSGCGAVEVHLVAVDILPAAFRHQAMVAVYVWLASVASIMIAVFLNEKIVAVVGTKARLLRTIGLVTYPLYLIHDVVGASVLRTSVFLGQGAALVLAFGSSLALAYAVVRLEPWIRQPLLAGLDTMKNYLEGRMEALRQSAASSALRITRVGGTYPASASLLRSIRFRSFGSR